MDMKRTIRFFKVAILILFGACTILLVGGIYFSVANINESQHFFEPAYKENESSEKFNPKSDNFWPYGDFFKEKNIPEVIQL